MTECDPLISIVIPAYNCEDCLERCVKSVAAQTYRNLEIIIVDDGSADQTPALCDSLASADSRIKVIHKSNGGTSSARNSGIDVSEGAYLGFVDSDDHIEPYVYERLMDAISMTGVKAAQISRDELNEDGTRRADVCVPPTQRSICSGRDFLKSLLLHQGDCSLCTKLIQRELFRDRRFPEGELNEDFKLFVSMLPETGDIVILPEQGYHVVYRSGSNTRKDSGEFPQIFTDIVNNADWVQRITDRDYPDLHDYAVRFGLIQRLDYMLHIPTGMMNGGNLFYVNVCGYLRRHYEDICKNPYLNDKQRRDLKILTRAPAAARKAHGLMMRMRRGMRKQRGCNEETKN